MHWGSGGSAPPGVLAGRRVSRRRLIAAGVLAALVIIAAVLGHAIVSSDSIMLGDCVVTSPNLASGWDIGKVACSSDPGAGQAIQKVASVQAGANRQCDRGLTTFQDDQAGKTYCLTGSAFGG